MSDKIAIVTEMSLQEAQELAELESLLFDRDPQDEDGTGNCQAEEELRPCLVADGKWAIGYFVDGEFNDWQSGPVGDGSRTAALAYIEGIAPSIEEIPAEYKRPEYVLPENYEEDGDADGDYDTRICGRCGWSEGDCVCGPKDLGKPFVG